LKGRPHLERARNLRHRPTDAEARLWRELRDRRFSGFKIRRQQPMGGFIVDFCCLEARLSLELDGGEHAEERQANYDVERTDALNRMGIRELRFWNTAVFENLAGVLATIEDELKSASAPSPTASR
jgi:very-short-patch-repair endonuclease